MPFPPKELPPELGEVFLARDVAGFGLSAGRVRRTDLDRTTWGVRARSAPTDLLQRCRMLQVRLPDSAFFSGPTAALLLGAPLPFRLERPPELDVTVPSPRRAPHASGIVGHSRRVFPGDVTETDGVRHSSPPRVWCELARLLELADLVAVGDHLLHHRRTSPSELGSRLRFGDRISRTADLRVALPLLSDGAESRPESQLRVLLALGGLPKPQVNHTIVMTDGGPRVRPDFRFDKEMLVLEYQGDYHRTREQWRKDMTRRSRLESVGWAVVELNADDLRNPQELCARVSAILARRR
ncbi:MAG TPA: DUF559 domain-containing protein [Pseudolysinimonas sp.]|nr:DUF559 domain-containing protein [Pseudolysinimonas sp.]